MHEHWKANCPEMREVESQKTQHAIQEEWRDQVERRARVSKKLIILLKASFC